MNKRIQIYLMSALLLLQLPACWARYTAQIRKRIRSHNVKKVSILMDFRYFQSDLGKQSTYPASRAAPHFGPQVAMFYLSEKLKQRGLMVVERKTAPAPGDKTAPGLKESEKELLGEYNVFISKRVYYTAFYKFQRI